MEVRQARLFRNGRNQAIRIPKDFELPGKLATITRSGDALIIRPAVRRSLLAVLKDLESWPAGDEFPDVDDTLLPLDDPLAGEQ